MGRSQGPGLEGGINYTGNGQKLTLEQGKTCKHLWLVKMDDQIVGRFLVYVDDVIITGATEIVVKVTELIQNLWDCKISGIIPGCDSDEEYTDQIERVKKLNFLGMTLEKIKKQLYRHQHQYILTKLRDRNLLEGHGKHNLPMAQEGRLAPEDKMDEGFAGRKHLLRLKWELSCG